MRSRTSSPPPAAFISSLALSAARPSTAHWPLERPVRGGRSARAVVLSVVCVLIGPRRIEISPRDEIYNDPLLPDWWSTMWSAPRIIEHVFDPALPHAPPLRAG